MKQLPKLIGFDDCEYHSQIRKEMIKLSRFENN